jgi:D-arabinose 1-dehydrogenase-like Zn-dependent alcohol dehydrogenase
MLSNREEFQELLDFVAKHDIKATVRTFNGLQSLPDIFDAMTAGKTVGKMAVVVDEDAFKAEAAKL